MVHWVAMWGKRAASSTSRDTADREVARQKSVQEKADAKVELIREKAKLQSEATRGKNAFGGMLNQKQRHKQEREEAEAARPRSAWRAPSLRPPEPSCLSSRRHSISGDVRCVQMCACSCGGPVLCVA